MWLLLFVLIVGFWNTMDAVGSAAFRLSEIDKHEGLTHREKIEFAFRAVRLVLGFVALLAAFLLALRA